jgi:hypothetical protein
MPVGLVKKRNDDPMEVDEGASSSAAPACSTAPSELTLHLIGKGGEKGGGEKGGGKGSGSSTAVWPQVLCNTCRVTVAKWTRMISRRGDDDEWRYQCVKRVAANDGITEEAARSKVMLVAGTAAAKH